MTEDRALGSDTASVRAFPPPMQEKGMWHTITRVEKYNDGREPDGHPDEVVEREGNLLCNAGIQVMLNLLAKNAGTVYSTAANAYVAAGDDNTPAVATDATLGNEYVRFQATAVVTDQSVAFSANFAAGQATGVWEEVGVLNAAAAGDLLNHVVSALGTKAAGAAWVLTITITIS